MPYYEFDEGVDDSYEGEFYEPANANFRPEDLESDARAVFDVLRQLGVKAVRCSYNGGHDEGFGEFEEAIIEDRTIEKLDLERQLRSSVLASRPAQIKLTYSAYFGEEAIVRVRYYLSTFASGLATALLGHYGTGQLSIRGRFIADFETGAIADIQEQ